MTRLFGERREDNSAECDSTHSMMVSPRVGEAPQLIAEDRLLGNLMDGNLLTHQGTGIQLQRDQSDSFRDASGCTDLDSRTLFIRR